MKWLDRFSLRGLLFAVGGIVSIAEAVNLAQKADAQVTPAHLIAVGGVALLGFAAKWPSDVTAEDAEKRVRRARRESMLPPPGDEP